MKNIRFYEAEKYNSSDYEKVEDMIYKTLEEKDPESENLCLRQCSDDELASKLKKLDDWKQGEGEFLKEFNILVYEGRQYYREIENIGTDEDIVFVNEDEAPAGYIYVTSIVFVPEPDLGENDPADTYVSQYPLEDILDEYFVYCYDEYEEENSSDKENSYVEFASEDVEDIRNVLKLIGKHVYNKEEGEYVKLIIE